MEGMHAGEEGSDRSGRGMINSLFVVGADWVPKIELLGVRDAHATQGTRSSLSLPAPPAEHPAHSSILYSMESYFSGISLEQT